jgi:glycosyltransferase involved in cell wall biosynthesis
MRIAYVSADPGVPVFGNKGSSVHVQAILGALGGLGVDIDLFAMRLGGERPPHLGHVGVHPLGPLPKADTAGRERAALRANPRLAAALERRGPFDLVYERQALWSFAAMEYARASGVPGLLEVNAPLIEEQATHRELVDRTGAERAAARAFAAASSLLAVSTGVASYLDGRPEARGRIHVLPNGVDPARFPRRVRSLRPAGEFVVGFVGTLKPWHGLDVLVDAFAQLRRTRADARLLIVGDGPQRIALERRLAELGLREAARLTGAVSPSQVPILLSGVDAAVAPYPHLDRFYFSPLKLFEYMAAGLPVVASAVGQVAEMLEDGVTGLLCPPGDPGALAAALARVAEDTRLGDRLGRAARAQALLAHSWNAVAQRILSVAGCTPTRPPAEVAS